MPLLLFQVFMDSIHSTASYCVQVITNNLLYVGVIFLLLGSYKSLALKEDDPSVE